MKEPKSPITVFVLGALEASGGVYLRSILPEGWHRHKAEQMQQDWAYLLPGLVVELELVASRWQLVVSLKAADIVRLPLAKAL